MSYSSLPQLSQPSRTLNELDVGDRHHIHHRQPIAGLTRRVNLTRPVGPGGGVYDDGLPFGALLERFGGYLRVFGEVFLRVN